MERKDSPEYDFNEPLLENVFDIENWHSGDVIIALLFLSDGRHAGPKGDIAHILDTVQKQYPKLNLHCTGAMGVHPVLHQIILSKLGI